MLVVIITFTTFSRAHMSSAPHNDACNHHVTTYSSTSLTSRHVHGHAIPRRLPRRFITLELDRGRHTHHSVLHVHTAHSNIQYAQLFYLQIGLHRQVRMIPRCTQPTQAHTIEAGVISRIARSIYRSRVSISVRTRACVLSPQHPSFSRDPPYATQSNPSSH